MPIFTTDQTTPVVIAGPCAAESFELMIEVATSMQGLAEQHGFIYVFKASFDKANRTSVNSYRGPGLKQAVEWFATLKKEVGCWVTTDVHETSQVEKVAEVVDVIQIPAFLCRQTDLVAEAVASGRAVTVKKGQFLDPSSCAHIVEKARASVQGGTLDFALMERGSTFGYGNLVVDMRGLKTMAANDVPVLLDVTHSTQQPSSGLTTGGLRHCAPLLARAAAATGYIHGLFLEVHPEPRSAKSDAATQLTINQAAALLEQVVPLIKQGKALRRIDASFD